MLGEKLGVLLLVEVIFAVFVCALAVHAAAVRLMFAMARDNNLPFAVALSHVSPRTRAPIVPSLVIGVLAAAILIVNVNLPNVIEMLCSVAIVWANLAYLMVTIPLLLSRRKPRAAAPGSVRRHRAFVSRNGRSRLVAPRALFFAGAIGPAGQRGRGRLGALRRHQHQLAALRRFTATIPGAASPRPWRPSRLIAAGAAYYVLYQRKRIRNRAQARCRRNP